VALQSTPTTSKQSPVKSSRDMYSKLNDNKQLGDITKQTQDLQA